MVFADLQGARNRGQIVAPAQARGAQILAHRLQRRFAVAGNFAQMDAAAAGAAIFVKTAFA